MLKLMSKQGLSIKFVPPIVAGAILSMAVGAYFIIAEARHSTAEQANIAANALSAEQRSAGQALSQALESKANVIGNFMAKTAPDFILSYDFTSLNAFTEEAAKDKDVAYTAYLKPDESAMIEFTRPEGVNLLEKRYPISYDGDVLGFVQVGMSKAAVNQGLQTSNERIAAATAAVESSADASMSRFFTIIIINMIAIVAVLTVILVLLFRAAVIRPLRETRALVQSLAEGHGDLTVKLPVKNNDEIGQLRQSVNGFVESLRNMVSIIASEVQYLSKEAGGLSHSSGELQHSSEEQRAQTTQVATAMNEMTATVQEVARNVAEAASAAEKGQSEAQNGQVVVNATVQSIRRLSNEVESAAEVIARLEESSERIGSVLDVINGIAEQTNLLALNAAIEAARAGEQGRGFAVVADEVRTLASRTHESTLEIREMIETVQSGTNEAVTAMERGQGAARDSVSQVEKAGGSLESILGMVSTITDMNTQIASAAEEQSLTAEEINRNVESINEISERTASGAGQTSASSDELTQLSGRLSDLVGQFKV